VNTDESGKTPWPTSAKLSVGLTSVVAVVAIIFGATAGSDSSDPVASQGNVSVLSEENDTSSADEGTTATEEGTTATDASDELIAKLQCDYLLSGGYRFVAGGTIENPTDSDRTVNVTASWELLGSAPLTKEQTVTVAAGETNSVQFSIDAKVAEIDQHQSANSRCTIEEEVVEG